MFKYPLNRGYLQKQLFCNVYFKILKWEIQLLIDEHCTVKQPQFPDLVCHTTIMEIHMRLRYFVKLLIRHQLNIGSILHFELTQSNYRVWIILNQLLKLGAFLSRASVNNNLSLKYPCPYFVVFFSIKFVLCIFKNFAIQDRKTIILQYLI